MHFVSGEDASWYKTTKNGNWPIRGRCSVEQDGDYGRELGDFSQNGPVGVTHEKVHSLVACFAAQVSK